MNNNVPDAMSRYPTDNGDPILRLEDDIAAISTQHDNLETASMKDFLNSIRCEEPSNSSIDEEAMSLGIERSVHLMQLLGTK